MTSDTPANPNADLARRLQDALGDGYVVERELGAGGFAVVYLVHDVSLKRKLAVKVLSPDLLTSTTVLERFRREAETVAQLSHANIVPLHFIGQKDGLLYLAMACVDGGSLAERITPAGGGRMAIEAATRAMSEVASALSHAHKRGVIHRDIKPQNVLIDTESGRCLVTDFGIARTAEGTSLTATGMMVGTPAYLAPEQVTGEPSDHRADLFALGVMAYEMFTGKQPYDAPTPTAVLMKRLGGPPEPMVKLRADVPRAIQEVVQGCLATDPAERFQTADDVVNALGGSAPGTPQVTAQFVLRARRESKRRWVVGVAVVAVLAVAAVLVLPKLRFDGGAATSAAPAPGAGMSLIAAGDYIVGSDAGLARPQHTVTLPAFRIDRHEITIAEYAEFVRAKSPPLPWSSTVADSQIPVTNVMWAEATSYCRWKHPPNGDLPSEEQWEAAARGREGRRYPWGNAFTLAAANTASARRTAPARPGSFPQGMSPDSLVDLIGNVWEWTRSSLRAYPGAATTADTLDQVIRGGAFNTPDTLATASYRGHVSPGSERKDLSFTGFRCVMAVTDK